MPNLFIKAAEAVRIKMGLGNNVDKQYLDLLEKVFKTGEDIEGRNGMVRKTFGHMMEFDHEEGYPIPTSKKTLHGAAVAEMTAFIRGESSNKKFMDLGCNVWKGNCFADYWMSNPNNKKPGDDLGRIYGVQWRQWDGGIDQLKELVDTLMTNPHDRRMIVSSWNPTDMDKMSLPPCPVLFQVFVRDGKYLDFALYQRSCDMFLGVPFDIVGYSYLQTVIAKLTGYKPGKFKYFLADTHIYHNHFEQVKEQLGNRLKTFPLPKAELDWPSTDMNITLESFSPEDFKLVGYKSQRFIKAPMSA
ncbi:thymidylate synthase [Vibrio phage VAP7]|uniref:thymidylate synthase n=1 Tax=Vibrio phage VAP7 TaxID=2584487 RepID=A0A4Y5TV20_9CAUD|nr:thymidylate synthase [Vibrio phage VAP7]QDB73214.1 thymidylate synthase [Vibrio phage VAP7]UFD98101.1 thymidylate synthase [Vibrio phage BX-1]